MTLVEAIAPSSKIKEIGIRPGEKLHEEMITVSDSPYTVDLGKYYAILSPTLVSNIDDYCKDNKFLHSVDIVISEKCTLNCKDCSNLMQYYKKPQNSEINLLFKSIERIMECIDNLDEFRVLGGDPFMNKELYKIINKLVTYEKCKRIVVYTNAKKPQTKRVKPINIYFLT